MSNYMSKFMRKELIHIKAIINLAKKAESTGHNDLSQGFRDLAKSMVDSSKVMYNAHTDEQESLIRELRRLRRSYS